MKSPYPRGSYKSKLQNDQDCDINTKKYIDFKREEHHDVQKGDIMMTLCHEQVIHDQLS
jgi:hypothetical protein